MKNFLNIVIWGYGAHAQKNIVPTLLKSKKFNLYGICSRKKKSFFIKKKINSIIWNSADEMLQDNLVDVVYLCVPISLHFEFGLKILKAGKHFWSEKSFTSNLKETKKIIDLSRRKKLTVAEGLMYKYHNQFLWIEKFIEKKSPKIINARFMIPYKKTQASKYNFLNKGNCVSILLDLGIYPISLSNKIIKQKRLDIIFKYLELKKKKETTQGIILSSANKTIFNLTWGINSSYKNDLEILANDWCFNTDKIFSKTESFVPKINLADKFGKKKIIKLGNENQFEKMFNHFFYLTTNLKAAELERVEILSLSKLCERIKKYKNNKIISL